MRQFLLVYRRSSGLVSIEDLGALDPSAAMRKRFEVERREIGDSDVEVVLLSAPSREALKRTHSRYFKTGEELTADMAEVLR